MENGSFFLAAVAAVYGRHPRTVSPLRRTNPEGKDLYRIDFSEGSSWVMRAYKQSYSTSDIYHWLSRSPSLVEWLQSHAHILAYIATQGYPAPIVIPTQTGALIGEYKEWYILMTTFVNGDAKDASPEKMAALSASLGHLHTLDLPKPRSSLNLLVDSWWSQACLHDGFTRLTSSVHAVSEEWLVFYNACLQTFHYFLAHSPLPQTLTHGDCWAENGIQTYENQGLLIDWECAGVGISVLDFGSLLLHCHFDQIDRFEKNIAPQYEPDPQRIKAVVNGYSRWRHLSSEEDNVLLEAIRFSIAWRGAWFFSLMGNGGLNERLEYALKRWNRWYVISEEIARLSHIALEQV
jgi:Ser/Thr protein kinase RdoA (MazF antagonist)